MRDGVDKEWIGSVGAKRTFADSVSAIDKGKICLGRLPREILERKVDMLKYIGGCGGCANTARL